MSDDRFKPVADWFWQSFVCRFRDGNLPMPGDPLYGHRFRLQWEDVDGEWRDFKRDGT